MFSGYSYKDYNQTLTRRLANLDNDIYIQNQKLKDLAEIADIKGDIGQRDYILKDLLHIKIRHEPTVVERLIADSYTVPANNRTVDERVERASKNIEKMEIEEFRSKLLENEKRISNTTEKPDFTEIVYVPSSPNYEFEPEPDWRNQRNQEEEYLPLTIVKKQPYLINLYTGLPVSTPYTGEEEVTGRTSITRNLNNNQRRQENIPIISSQINVEPRSSIEHSNVVPEEGRSNLPTLFQQSGSNNLRRGNRRERRHPTYIPQTEEELGSGIRKKQIIAGEIKAGNNNKSLKQQLLNLSKRK
jgi:hypothetical protein